MFRDCVASSVALQTFRSGDLRPDFPPVSLWCRLQDFGRSSTTRVQCFVMGRSQWTPGLGPARFLQRRCNQKSCRCALRSGVDRCTSPRAPRAGNSAARVRCVPHHVSRAARKRFSRAERGLSRRGLRRHPASARSLGGGLCGRSRCVRGPIQAPDDPPRPQDRRFSLGRACIAAFTATATAYHRHTHRQLTKVFS